MGVYVFGEPGMLIVKVGHTGAVGGPREREMSLKRQFSRAGEMLYETHYLHGTQMLERRVHRLLKPRYWLEGEWFVCGADVAIRAIRRAIKQSWRERKGASRRACAKSRTRPHKSGSTVFQLLQQWQTENCVTNTELAKEIGVSPSGISRAKRGLRVLGMAHRVAIQRLTKDKVRPADWAEFFALTTHLRPSGETP